MSQESGSITANGQAVQDTEPTWAQLGLHTYVRIAVVAILLAVLFRTQLRWIVRTWNNDPSWSHGYLIPLFSLYFLNQRKREILTLQPRPSVFGLVLLVACLVFFVLNVTQFRIAYFERLTPLPTLAAVILFLGGWRLLRHTWLPVAFLLFAIPLPVRLYKGITIPMRLIASDVARWVLDLVPGLDAGGTGVVIDVVYRGQVMDPSLNVAEACSGIRLLMAFVALGVAMAYLHPRPVIQRIILLISTIPIAILCNIIRVTITGLIYVLWDPRYAQGRYHDMLGLAMLPVAFALYGALAWYMNHLFIDEQMQSTTDVIVRRRPPASESV